MSLVDQKVFVVSNIRVSVRQTPLKKSNFPCFSDTNGVKLSRPNFLSKLFCPTIFCSSPTKDKMTQKGYGPTAVQTELQRVPRVHLTKPIIALFVVMKAQFSEVYYNKSHSENSGNGSTGRRGCDGSAVA